VCVCVCVCVCVRARHSRTTSVRWAILAAAHRIVTAHGECEVESRCGLFVSEIAVLVREKMREVQACEWV
jgi:hypothetical protein